MRSTVILVVLCAALVGLGCERGVVAPTPLPGAPPVASTPNPPVPPPPNPSFPSIAVGDIVRFQFTAGDTACVGAGGRCRSYNITPSSDGWLQVVLASVAGTEEFVRTTEMYVVPGGDWWNVGPGPQISVGLQVRANGTYEIRMFSSVVPSVELELRSSMK